MYALQDYKAPQASRVCSTLYQVSGGRSSPHLQHIVSGMGCYAAQIRQLP